MGLEVPFDFHDAGYGIAGLSEEFQTDGANVLRHAMQHPTRRGDQAVTTFLLHPRQPAQELIGDVLTESRLAEPRAVDVQSLAAEDLGVFRISASVFPHQVE